MIDNPRPTIGYLSLHSAVNIAVNVSQRSLVSSHKEIEFSLFSRKIDLNKNRCAALTIRSELLSETVRETVPSL